MIPKKWAVAFVVCTILATAFFFFTGMEPERMNITWRGFQAALRAGDYAQAASLLDGQAGHRISLSDWAIVFEAQNISCSPLQTAALIWPQETRQAGFTMNIAGKEVSFSLTMKHDLSGWRIAALPELHVSPSALLYPYDGTMRLQMGERNHLLPDQPYSEVPKLGFALCEREKLLYWQEAEVYFEEYLASLAEGNLRGSSCLLPVASKITLYQQKHSQGYRVLTDLSPGMVNLQLCLWQGQVVGGLLEPSWSPERIRVLLRGSNQSEMYLQEPVLLSGTEISLRQGGASWRPLAAEELWISSENGAVVLRDDSGADLALSDTQSVQLVSNMGQIALNFGNMAAIERKVRGVLEIAHGASGILLINEVPLEEYLQGVVVNEMPESFGSEALQAQAIVARGYALQAILHPGVWARYGAHLDDSTNSQVYLRSSPESSAGNTAVAETQGEILFYQGQPAQTPFFSTSGGFTAASKEAWPAGPGSDGEERHYLKGLAQGYNLPLQRDEESILAFYRRSDWQIPDRSSPWFRWQLRLDYADLAALFEANLTHIADLGTRLLQVQDRFGQFVTLEASGSEDLLGDLLELNPVRRAANGQLLVLEIRGSKATYRVHSELLIRRLFQPAEMVRPIYQLGTGNERALELLPSAFVAWQEAEDGAGEGDRVATFYGGGYGHGVGLSQYGVQGLLQAGWSVPRILQHYYPSTEQMDWRQWWD